MAAPGCLVLLETFLVRLDKKLWTFGVILTFDSLVHFCVFPSTGETKLIQDFNELN